MRVTLNWSVRGSTVERSGRKSRPMEKVVGLVALFSSVVGGVVAPVVGMEMGDEERKEGGKGEAEEEKESGVAEEEKEGMGIGREKGMGGREERAEDDEEDEREAEEGGGRERDKSSQPAHTKKPKCSRRSVKRKRRELERSTWMLWAALAKSKEESLEFHTSKQPVVTPAAKTKVQEWQSSTNTLRARELTVNLQPRHDLK